jgi:hypothetical protein
MSPSVFSARAREILSGLKRREGTNKRRPDTRQSLKLESLESRALLAISATGYISSVAAGANFDYTIALTNSSASTSSIGTFWYAWTPGQDYLATKPIPESLPAGWVPQIFHSGTGDGYSIEFIASDPNAYLQPGNTLNFKFASADTPQSVTGNSKYYTTTPVGTSFLYPLTPFNNGVKIDVTIAPPPPPPGPTGAELVTISTVILTRNKRHLVTQITIDFSGAVNAAEAQSVATYRLVLAGKKGSFVAKNAKTIGLRSAVLNSVAHTVTLTPKKPFALTKPIQLTVNGQSPSGLQDSQGLLIDGNHDGVAGGNGIAVLSKKGTTLS